MLLCDIIASDTSACCKSGLEFSRLPKEQLARSGGNGDIRRLPEAGHQDRHSC